MSIEKYIAVMLNDLLEGKRWALEKAYHIPFEVRSDRTLCDKTICSSLSGHLLHVYKTEWHYRRSPEYLHKWKPARAVKITEETPLPLTKNGKKLGRPRLTHEERLASKAAARRRYYAKSVGHDPDMKYLPKLDPRRLAWERQEAIESAKHKAKLANLAKRTHAEIEMKNDFWRRLALGEAEPAPRAKLPTTKPQAETAPDWLRRMEIDNGWVKPKEE